ncbi:unnamed protein product, partial [Porites evermanni]
DNGLLHKLQVRKEDESDGGHPLISMECAWPMTALVDKRLSVSKELSVLFVLIGPDSVDDDVDSIDPEADADSNADGEDSIDPEADADSNADGEDSIDPEADADSVADNVDSIDLEANATIDVVFSKVSLDMIPRPINI